MARPPLLLHIALAAAPTSSIYYKPLLIGRMRRPNGPEIVINAIPFAPTDRQNIETFAARINPAFYPLPQGARTTITVEEDFPAAFDTFRSIQKRTGKNFAAFSGDYHAAMWAAIRAGWRSPYTIALDYSPDSTPAALQPLCHRPHARSRWRRADLPAARPAPPGPRRCPHYPRLRSRTGSC